MTAMAREPGLSVSRVSHLIERVALARTEDGEAKGQDLAPTCALDWIGNAAGTLRLERVETGQVGHSLLPSLIMCIVRSICGRDCQLLLPPWIGVLHQLLH